MTAKTSKERMANLRWRKRHGIGSFTVWIMEEEIIEFLRGEGLLPSGRVPKDRVELALSEYLFGKCCKGPLRVTYDVS